MILESIPDYGVVLTKLTPLIDLLISITESKMITVPTKYIIAT
jgi:hypothetical protein